MSIWNDASSVKPVTGEDCIVLIQKDGKYYVNPEFVHYYPPYYMGENQPSTEAAWHDLHDNKVEKVVAWIRPEDLKEDWKAGVSNDTSVCVICGADFMEYGARHKLSCPHSCK